MAFQILKKRFGNIGALLHGVHQFPSCYLLGLVNITQHLYAM